MTYTSSFLFVRTFFICVRIIHYSAFTDYILETKNRVLIL